MNRIALVTGCSSGFGASTVAALLEAGWQVIATVRDPAHGDNTLAARYPGRLDYQVLDVTASAQRAALTRHLDQSYRNRLDALVLNAGYGLVGPLELLEESEIERLLATNLSGAIQLTRCLLPALRATHGRIVCISSAFGLIGFPLNTIYCASKFGLEGFAEALRYELAPHQVQVALLEPGRHRTRFGEHTVWPATREEGDYSRQMEGMRRLVARFRRRPAPAAEPVAAAIVSLCQSRRLPLRRRVGRDAQGIYYGKRLLPQFLWDKLLQRLTRRLFLDRDDSS